MHILYFVQYFNLPHEPGGSRPFQLARALVREGHRVTIVTGAVNHKTLSVAEKYRGRLFVEEEVEGIRVIRAWSYAGIRGSFGKRFINFLSFAVSALLAGATRVDPADLVYASSTPLTVGLPGLLASRLHGAPFVFETRDLWPESAVIAGVLRREALPTRAAAWLARLFARKASLLVAVTRGIKEGLEAEGAPPDKVLLIPNGVDDWMSEVGEPGPEPDDEFRLVYCGAHGRWNGLGQLIDAAALLRDEPRFVLEMIGDGDEKRALMQRVREAGLDNVRFVDALPKREAFERIRAGSASVVVTWAHPFQRMVLSNKIFDYLAAGRPVVLGAEGEMAELVGEAGCGVIAPPEQPEQLAEAIRRVMRMDRAERRELGERGRRHILGGYRRDQLARRLLERLELVLHEERGRPYIREREAVVPSLKRAR